MAEPVHQKRIGEEAVDMAKDADVGEHGDVHGEEEGGEVVVCAYSYHDTRTVAVARDLEQRFMHSLTSAATVIDG